MVPIDLVDRGGTGSELFFLNFLNGFDSFDRYLNFNPTGSNELDRFNRSISGLASFTDVRQVTDICTVVQGNFLVKDVVVSS